MPPAQSASAAATGSASADAAPPTSAAADAPPPRVAGRVFFSEAEASPPVFEDDVYFIDSVTTDHTLVASIEQTGEGLPERSLLVKRMADGKQVRLFEVVSEKESSQYQQARSPTDMVGAYWAIRARVTSANAWLSGYEWESLEPCEAWTDSVDYDNPSEIACRANAGLREVTLDRRQLRVVRMNGTMLRRDVSRWFPWFVDGETSTRGPPVISAWARPKKGGPLVVFTYAKMNGPCQEPMSDMHVLQMPQ